MAHGLRGEPVADHAAPVTLLGVDVDRLDRRAARELVVRMADRPGHDVLAFVNAHALNLASRDLRYRVALHEATVVLNDGLGIGIAARLEGLPFTDNLNGSDLLPLVLADLAAVGHSVFFYGAAPGVAETTAAVWSRRIPGLRVAGTLDGYTLSAPVAAEFIRGTGADVVLVALGNPKQEVWSAGFGARTGARLTIGVGAFFDFSAGVVRRAPRFVRRARLEWAFRLVQEPRRLAGRYVVGIPVFLGRIAWSRVRPVPHPLDPSVTARHPSAGGPRDVGARPAADDPVVVRGPWPGGSSDVEQAG